MPELPEVQTIVDDLNRKILGRKITGVWFDAPKIIKKPAAKVLEKQIKGLKIDRVERRGKNILIYLTKGFLLLVHQKLTGHLLVGKWRITNGKVIPRLKGHFGERVNDYIHLVFNLDSGWQIALSDLRKFAKVLFGANDEIEKMPDLTDLGPEPLDKNFTFPKFRNLIHAEKRKIKQVLMDQKVIAGIGNIYSDEILWGAKIHPFKPANKLNEAEMKKIYAAMCGILEKAVKLRGTSTSDFRDTAGKKGGYTEIRKVYQKENEPCPRCNTPIKRIKLGGRSAHYCPKCQKL
jgi:formamidopyrimidine-DNA glycosylase